MPTSKPKIVYINFILYMRLVLS